MRERLIYSVTSAFNMTPLWIFELYILTSIVCDACGVRQGSQAYLCQAKIGRSGVLSDEAFHVDPHCVYSLHLITLTDPDVIGNVSVLQQKATKARSVCFPEVLPHLN